MKKSILVLIFILAVLHTLYPSDFSKEFETANSLYGKGEYRAALKHYSGIEKDIYHWKLFYNLGNTWFKLGDPLRAKIYYLKAKRLKPSHSAINRNLEIVEQKLNNNVRLKGPDFISRALSKIGSVITIDVLSVLIIFALVFFAFFEIKIIRDGKSKPRIYGIVISLIFLLMFTSILFLRVNNFNTSRLAVVIEKGSKLRSGPGADNTVLFDIGSGVTVKIVEQNREWFQVAASEEIAGWIESEKIEMIR